MPKILQTAKSAGYDGVEVGWHRIDATSPETFKRLLEESGLQLASSHMGGNLEDPSQADNERKQVDIVTEGVKAMGSSFLLYSGAPIPENESIEPFISRLNHAAVKCHEQGIHLLYHNHAFEFDHGHRIFNALINDTVDQLGFAPDVGWLHKGGVDAVETLESLRQRIHLVHFKDFAHDQNADTSDGSDSCLLGEGIAPLHEAAEWIKSLQREEIWVIAEQDYHKKGSADEAAIKNGEFLQGCFGGAR